MTSIDPFEVGFPNELLVHLFGNFSLSGLGNLRLVCKRWKDIVDVSAESSTLELKPKRLEIQNAISTMILQNTTKNIRVISFESCFKITDEMLKKVCEHVSHSLEALNLKRCGNLKHLNCLALCTKLERLDISESIGIQLLSMAESLPSAIKILLMDQLPALNASVLSCLAQRHRDPEPSATPDENRQSSASNVMAIEVISMIDSNIRDGDLIPFLISAGKSLKVLYVSYSLVSDASIETASRACPHLEVLSLEGLTSITDHSIKMFASSCPQLRFLNLGGLFRLTDSSIDALMEHCPNLMKVNCTSCNSISEDASTRLTQLIESRK